MAFQQNLRHCCATEWPRFHSVSLNVNNPHFFIMQGRITKVINMKPQETLSMIEEAAGTRMYENKKAVALKTLEKKQNKAQPGSGSLCGFKGVAIDS